MSIPHYINEDKSDMRAIKPGWYAMEDNGKLSSGPFSSPHECLRSNPMRHFGRLLRRASLRPRIPTRKRRWPQGTQPTSSRILMRTATKGATEYNLKIIEIASTNTNAAFEHAQQLLGVKSPSEFVELSTAHARKQFDTMIAQTKELTELAQKVTTKITEPLKVGVTMAFNKKVA
jgi:phasin